VPAEGAPRRSSRRSHGATATTGSGRLPSVPGPPRPLAGTGGYPHDGLPALARSRSGRRPAPGVEGTGKHRERPATGDSNHAVASELPAPARKPEPQLTKTSAGPEGRQPPTTRTPAASPSGRPRGLPARQRETSRGSPAPARSSAGREGSRQSYSACRVAGVSWTPSTRPMDGVAQNCSIDSPICSVT
jgi:hypothetical protein